MRHITKTLRRPAREVEVIAFGLACGCSSSAITAKRQRVAVGVVARASGIGARRRAPPCERRRLDRDAAASVRSPSGLRAACARMTRRRKTATAVMGIRAGAGDAATTASARRSYTTRSRRAASRSANMRFALLPSTDRERRLRWPRSFRSPTSRARAQRAPRRVRARGRDAPSPTRRRSPTRAAGRCATCASRSPTAAISAASTACRRTSSARDYPFLPHAELLTFEEIARVARVFVDARRARRSA